jgi:VanZ family protein
VNAPLEPGIEQALVPTPEPAVAPRSSLRALAAWLPAALYTGLIWFLSSQTLDIKLIEDVPMKDKGVHFVEYGVLGLLLAFACNATWPRARRRYLLAWWLTWALGLVDELHQLYVPGRSADALDLAADSLGAALAIGAFALLRSRWARR